jgi:hypothetical protein
MAQGKAGKIETRNNIDGKLCTFCEEWKPLDEFHKKKGGVGCRQPKCKRCSLTEKHNSYKLNREHKLLYNRDYYQRNRESLKQKVKEYRDTNKDKIIKYIEINKERRRANLIKWRINNPEKFKLIYQRREARKRYLPASLNDTEMKKTLEAFDFSCALTGDTDNIHWDHVIPLSTGHVGTVFGNIIPLRSDLNASKNDSNIFEWFEDNRGRYDLSCTKFDSLIKWLAKVNGVSVHDYKDYVNWCHHNPHCVEDLAEITAE